MVRYAKHAQDNRPFCSNPTLKENWISILRDAAHTEEQGLQFVHSGSPGKVALLALHLEQPTSS